MPAPHRLKPVLLGRLHYHRGFDVLLHALGARFGIDENIENGQNVTAKIEHAREDVSQRRVALGFAVPLQQHRRWDFDIPPKLFRGMSPQEQAVEEGRFPLREIEIVPRLVSRAGDRH